jgi:hypothetical protein
MKTTATKTKSCFVTGMILLVYTLIDFTHVVCRTCAVKDLHEVDRFAGRDHDAGGRGVADVVRQSGLAVSEDKPGNCSITTTKNCCYSLMKAGSRYNVKKVSVKIPGEWT